MGARQLTVDRFLAGGEDVGQVVKAPLYRHVARSGQTQLVGGLGVRRQGTPHGRPTGSMGRSRGNLPVVSVGGWPKKLCWPRWSCPPAAWPGKGAAMPQRRPTGWLGGVRQHRCAGVAEPCQKQRAAGDVQVAPNGWHGGSWS
jgi:hypothetical protein